MKIRLIEPLSIDKDLLENYGDLLRSKGHDFKYYDDVASSAEEQKARIEDADIVIIASSPLPAEAFKDNENLKYINVAFTGFDHVDMDQANKMGVKVSNASGYSNTSVKELVLAMTLNLLRDLNQGDRAVREGKTHEDYYSGSELKGKTVGIIGTGNIGSEVAKLFQAFDTKVIANSRSENQELLDRGVEYKSIEEVFREADIISIHLALNDQTKGIISKDLIGLMKLNSILINAARGPIVDNEALAQALNQEKIAGAGIDVFDMEPPIPSDYPLLNAKNTLLLPHIAYLTKESMVKRAAIAFDNTISFIEGNPKNLVN